MTGRRAPAPRLGRGARNIAFLVGIHVTLRHSRCGSSRQRHVKLHQTGWTYCRLSLTSLLAWCE